MIKKSGSELFLCLYKKSGQFQLSIEEESGSGSRLFGPKFNGASTLIKKHRLEQHDRENIRRILKKNFPNE